MAESSISEKLNDDATKYPKNAVAPFDIRLVRLLWGLLGFLFLSLLGLASVLLVRSGIFSEGQLSDEQTKSVWAFLGVAFGAAATLIGALLAEQNNRRTAAITREAADRTQLAAMNQQRLAEEAEQRLAIDTVAKVLQLTTHGADYAKPAQVAGAIATLVELQRGTVAVRILGELWKDDAVDSETAVWLIDQILHEYPQASSEHDVYGALSLLIDNASKLLPPCNDPAPWSIWPDIGRSRWPRDFPGKAKNQLLQASAAILTSRDLKWWSIRAMGLADVIKMLVLALDDELVLARSHAGYILYSLVQSGMAGLFVIDKDLQLRVNEFADPSFAPWLAKLFDCWREGDTTMRAKPH
jgi:hypothetical protein